MKNQDVVKAKRNPVVTVIIGVLLVCSLVGIWYVKNVHKGEQPIPSDHPDFDLHVTEVIDLEQLKSYGLPIIIDFGAKSCIPCKEMAPVLEELNTELRGKAIVKFVDVWQYPKLSEGYPVSVIPTQFFFDAAGKPFDPKESGIVPMTVYSTRDTGEHVYTAHSGGMTKEQILAVLKEMGME